MISVDVKQTRFFNELPKAVARIQKGRGRYKEVEALTGIPWKVVGTIHYLEANCDFNKHLHNGDPLDKPTSRHPAGRPIGWLRLPASQRNWVNSAIDSLKYDKLDKVKTWDTPNTLDALERYNGLGYRKYHKDVPTPYLWSGTDKYIAGKYTEVKVNGKWKVKWNQNLVSQQIGAVLLLNHLS